MTEPDIADRKFQKELISGTAALVLLAVLDRAREPMYGYQIAKLIETSREEVPVKQGALYPVLRSLEAGNLLESRVEPSIQGPPRRYYSITDTGRAVLHRWIEIWNQTKTFVDSGVKGDQDG